MRFISKHAVAKQLLPGHSESSIHIGNHRVAPPDLLRRCLALFGQAQSERAISFQYLPWRFREPWAARVMSEEESVPVSRT